MPVPPYDELYKVRRLNLLFAVGSLALLFSLVLVVMGDYERDWKRYQKKFFEIDAKKTQYDITAAESRVDAAKVGQLEADLSRARAERKAKEVEARHAAREHARLKSDLYRLNMALAIEKSYVDSLRYHLEAARHHGKPVAENVARELAKREEQAAKLAREVEDLEVQVEAADASARSFDENVKALEGAMQQQVGEVALLKKRAQSLAPSLLTELLNAPLVDFVAPSLKVRQVVLPDLRDDYYFTTVEKVDRCMTCHMAIDQKGFEKLPNPYKTHPRLELFTGSASPHPMNEFGCTICHAGSGHSVNFVNSAHTPHDEAQKAQWEKTYGWKPMKHWEQPMLPLQHVEASCAKCHASEVTLPAAARYTQGKRLFETLGCFGCHSTEGFNDLRKAGPDLSRISSKVDRAWLAKWIRNPRHFRESTRMPRFFGLSNAQPEAEESTQIDAVAAYLVEKSKPHEFAAKDVPGGDAGRGKQLVNEVGCLGCHMLGDQGTSDHAPNLAGLGSKVTAVWLYNWLKDPKHYWAETRMPSLRLTDEEAADITAFLAGWRHAEFDGLSEPVPDAATLDRLVLEDLRAKMPDSQADEKLKAMSEKDKKLALAEQTILRYGCFGCHLIPGFEDAKPIGTELTEEGAKQPKKLDFGLIDLENTRWAWFGEKLKNTRLFDEGKVKLPADKLRMPLFDLKDEERGALVTFLLSRVKEEIPLEKQMRLSPLEQEVQAGERLERDLNCFGCHTINGEGGTIRDLYEDKGLAPPVLSHEGQKVQARWLFDFLKSPTEIRPWLKARMPTFGFTDEEAAMLVRHFEAEEGLNARYDQDALPPTTEEKLAVGGQVFEQFKCTQCHVVGGVAPAGRSAADLAPDLGKARARLKYDWIAEWLADPQKLEPGTRMPTFFPEGMSPLPDVLGGDANAQIEAIRDHVIRLAEAPAQGASAAPPAA